MVFDNRFRYGEACLLAQKVKAQRKAPSIGGLEHVANKEDNE